MSPNTGSTDGTLRWWDLATGRCLHVLQEHVRVVSAVALDAAGSHALLSCA